MRTIPRWLGRSVRVRAVLDDWSGPQYPWVYRGAYKGHPQSSANPSPCTLWLSSVESRPSMHNILVVILILLLLGALPTWPYSSGWGYYPSGGLALLILIVLVLAFSGRRGALRG